MEKFKENVTRIWNGLVDCAINKKMANFENLINGISKGDAEDAINYIYEYCRIQELKPLVYIIVDDDGKCACEYCDEEMYGSLESAQKSVFRADWSMVKGTIVVPSDRETLGLFISSEERLNSFAEVVPLRFDDESDPHEDNFFCVAHLFNGKVYADKTSKEWYNSYEPPERLLKNGDVVVSLENGKVELGVYDGPDNSVGISWNEKWDVDQNQSIILRPKENKKELFSYLIRCQMKKWQNCLSFYLDLFKAYELHESFDRFLLEENVILPFQFHENEMIDFRNSQNTLDKVCKELKSKEWNVERNVFLNGFCVDFTYGLNNKNRGCVFSNLNGIAEKEGFLSAIGESEKILQKFVEKNKDVLIAVFLDGKYFDAKSQQQILIPAKIDSKEFVDKTRVISNDSRCCALYEFAEKELQNIFGEPLWRSNAFEQETKKYLITSKILSYTVNGFLNDSIDYSGVCCPAVNALELELCKLFCRDFLNYQKEHFKDNISRYTSFFIVKNEKSELVVRGTSTESNLKRPDLNFDFTLGNLLYICGMGSEKDAAIEKLEKSITKFNVLRINRCMDTFSCEEKFTDEWKKVKESIKHKQKEKNNGFAPLEFDRLGDKQSVQTSIRKNNKQQVNTFVDECLKNSEIENDDFKKKVRSFISDYLKNTNFLVDALSLEFVEKRSYLLKSSEEMKAQSKENILQYIESILTPEARSSLEERVEKNSSSIKDEILSELTLIVKKVEEIRRNYRNLICHTETIDENQAKECLKLVVGEKKNGGDSVSNDGVQGSSENIEKKIYALLKYLENFLRGNEETSQGPTTQNP